MRGVGLAYELQAQQTDGSWKSIYRGKIYGIICGKQIQKVETTTVRLVINTKEIKQFDVF